MSNKTDHHAVSADEEFYYEETVVEHVDNRRRRTILATILVALLFLLMGTTWFVLKINTPTSAPSAADLPPGMMTRLGRPSGVNPAMTCLLVTTHMVPSGATASSTGPRRSVFAVVPHV